ncbi:MAG: hypothetical protein JWP88_2086 [Flaviaesturariibacter sp.]|nr:hypothetical protein [Flaviaesturariibacter sp.]
MLRSFLFVTALLLTFGAQSQPKRVIAVKTSVPIKIDGDLSDPAWQTAPLLTDFVQTYPSHGQPTATKTEARILYDNDAIYISAYLYDDPSLIRKQLTARDGEARQDVDYFSVFFDTYRDQQNGFQFAVTTANVQSDAKLGPNTGGNFGFGDFGGDKSWDAVWQSKTVIKADGWAVEMRIPYISLRFTKKEVQTWGLQVLRFTRRNNESDFWSPVSPNVAGFLNQFGALSDLRDIQPPLRLSFSPYISGGVRYYPEGYRQGTKVLKSGGMDVKWGLNESFTLDATLIPDFGQVISDNVVNNLTPYEVRFNENRPFFTEGTELFNKSGLFYSRRIGATPTNYYRVEGAYGNAANYEIIENPSVTQLYNAIKLSGRTQKKLGIGVFNAVTAPMRARVRDLNTKRDTSIQTEPLANYNLFVLDQAFKGRSSITFTNASVIRNGANRDANTSAFDWALYNKKNTHSLSGSLRYSTIFGYTPYSSAYFMNRDTVTINGRRFLKPYDGFTGRLRLAKVGGKIRYYGAVNIESVTYDPNDLGYLQAPNEVTYNTGISYYQLKPTKHFINYDYRFDIYYGWLFKPYKFTQIELSTQASWVFKNFWDIHLSIGGQPTGQMDYFELRNFDYRLHRPAFYYTSFFGSTDSRKKLYYSYGFGFANSPMPHSQYYQVSSGIRYRFSDQFTLSLDVNRQHDKLQIGSAFQNDPGIIGYRSSKDLESILSGIYNFTSRMNLTLRGRHYWNQVHYLSFHKVDANGDAHPISFIPGQDDNFNAFNLDAFYTWDFRAGSRLILGWKNWLGNSSAIDASRYKNYGKNLTRTFDLSHGNELTLRVIYFLDYNQLKKRK